MLQLACRWSRLAAPARPWLAACGLLLAGLPAGATSYEACRAEVSRGFVSRCTVSLGECTIHGCETRAVCSPGSLNCSNSLSGRSTRSINTGMHYCTDIGGVYHDEDETRVVDRLCTPEGSDAQRAARLEQLRKDRDIQRAATLAVATAALTVVESMLQPDTRRPTVRQPPPGYVPPGPADHIYNVCMRLSHLYARRLDAELRDIFMRTRTAPADRLNEAKVLEHRRTPLCRCTSQSALRQFSPAELAETRTPDRLWGQLPAARLAEVFGPCGQSVGLPAESMTWLYRLPTPAELQTR